MLLCLLSERRPIIRRIKTNSMAKKLRFQKVTGMHDVFGQDIKYFDRVREIAQDMADFYNFKRIETPILEEAGLFERTTGESSDIVRKEMFSFKTKGGDYLALRPEATPCVGRAYLENGMFNLPSPLKLWYFGPYFRYEHPQSGRFRQFNQIGFEILGGSDAVLDAQIIQVTYNLLKEFKLKDITLDINSIGDSVCRPHYKRALVNFLKSRSSSLCPDCNRRLKENPLRVLDCKKESCIEVVEKAPQIIDYLCDACHGHFKEVLEFLDESEIQYNLNPYLVRGLDYYTRTVFEFYGEKDAEGKRQDALGGGGRYDSLIKSLGGKDTPAVGVALGVERIISLMKNVEVKFPLPLPPKIFIAQLGTLAKKKSLKIMEDMRKANIRVYESFGKDSLRSQLKIADKVGAEYALILGQREVLEKSVILRNMKTGRQDLVKLDSVVEETKKHLRQKE